MKAEIKEEELMIGNIINWKGRPVKVTMIGEFGIQCTDDIGIINAKFSTPDLRGIPLTPEILEKCGLGWEHLGYSVIQCKIGELKLQSFCGSGWVLSCNGIELQMVKYLHQLQNLYFALTGTHLTIEL